MSQHRFGLPIAAVCVVIAAGLMYQNSQGRGLAPIKNPCLSQFYADTAPELTNVKLTKQSYPLCYGAFNLMYSGISRTPLWVAEHLNYERVSTKIKREDNFHEETRLPVEVRSRLDDYRSSGYDRGHMAPNGDMSDRESQYDSFSLANIVPQTPENNQNTWREIEESVRTMTGRYRTDVYVVTGPAFIGDKISTIKPGRAVLVPTYVYKAVVIPAMGVASAYVAPNDASYSAQVVSICKLEEKIGINLFPALSEQQKRQVYALPMQASAVRAERLPKLVNTDTTSACAPAISAEQVRRTAQQFVWPEGRTASQMSQEKNQQSAYPASANEAIIPILKWIKQL